MQQLLTGYTLVEGPCWDRGALFFSDIYDGGVHRLDGDGSVQVVIPKRRAVGGIACHAQGGLVVSGRDVQHVVDGTIHTLLADPTVRTYNDLTVDPAGRVIVGSVRDRYPDGTPVGGPGMVPEHRRLPFGELYRIGANGTEMLYEFDGLSNGIAFSPDGSRVFHVTSAEGLVVHDVLADGRWVHRRATALPPATADGLVADTHDRLWAAGGNAVTCLSFDGDIIEQVALPAGRVISLCFGGDDARDLYVTTGGNDASDHAGAVFVDRRPVAGVLTPHACV